MSPASATPDTTSIDAAQARVDQLSQKADTAQQRHDKAAAQLARTKAALRRTAADLRRHQQQIQTLRAQVAGEAVDSYDGTAGSAAPAAGVPTLDARGQQDSTAMLSNVVLVSEDAGAPAVALTRSNAQLTELGRRKVALQNRLDLLARGEQATRSMERTALSRKEQAASTLSALQAKRDAIEAKRIAAMGGPAVAYAKAQVGKAYVFGAAGPSAFDCSGLTMAAWSQAGVSLPHNAAAQYSSGRHISESELQPGDLVFYYSPISHVGMYIGNGQIVNAENPSAGVRIAGLHDMPYVGAVRPGS